VARQLLGMRLVRLEDGQRIVGIILEAEAYAGKRTLAVIAARAHEAHAGDVWSAGMCVRLFYLCMHWMLNFVTEEEGFPAAVSSVLSNRRRAGADCCQAPRPAAATLGDGPAKLCQALHIDGHLNGADLCAPEAVLFVEEGAPFPDSSVTNGPRVV